MPTANFDVNLFRYSTFFILLLMIFIEVIFQIQGRRFFVKKLSTSVIFIDFMLGHTDLVSVDQELNLIVIRMTSFHQTFYYLCLVFYGLLADEHVSVLSVCIP
jgi:hypothetical protein